MKNKAVLIFFGLAVAGCATPQNDSYYRPIIDSKDVDAAKMSSDVFDCNLYANKALSAGEGAAAGALAGALFMAAMAPSGYRNDWARSGLVAGGAAGAVGSSMNRKDIVSRCMVGRGYKVLG